MIGGQQVFALCQRFPFTSGCILYFGTGAFRALSASINDPSNVAADAVSVCCSRVVCMVCRLSTPSGGICVCSVTEVSFHFRLHTVIWYGCFQGTVCFNK